MTFRIVWTEEYNELHVIFADSFKDSPLTKLNGKMNDCLEYILDITIGYPNGKPLDLPNIVHGLRNPCQTYLFYRLYRSSEVSHNNKLQFSYQYQDHYT